MYKNNAQTISRACEKLKNNELLVEDILDEEDLVNDLKSPNTLKLKNEQSFLTKNSSIEVKGMIEEEENEVNIISTNEVKNEDVGSIAGGINNDRSN